jgi:hypothetical protein
MIVLNTSGPLSFGDIVEYAGQVWSDAVVPRRWLRTDKPWDDPAVTGKPVPVTVRIPPLDPLVHDAAYFRAVKRAPLHGRLLDGLRSYYF